jgi:hypothetical protein
MRYKINRHLIKYPSGERASRDEISWQLSIFGLKPFFKPHSANCKHLQVAKLPIGTKAVFHIHNVVVRRAAKRKIWRLQDERRIVENLAGLKIWKINRQIDMMKYLAENSVGKKCMWK